MPHDAARDRFSSTSWSLASRAHGADAATAHASLLALCLRYRYPVFACLRRSGQSPDSASRLAEAFFRDLLHRHGAPQDTRRFARFREFLQAELARFLASAPPLQPAQDPLPHPAVHELEARLRAEDLAQCSPEDVLRRGFAVEILASAHGLLRTEANDGGHGEMFAELERFLIAEPGVGDYDVAARRLQVRPVFISMAVTRLRQRFRELVDQALGETLASASELDSERAALLQVLAG
jgi:RNA polymerase sigma-70 factor (ECF subfamily)